MSFGYGFDGTPTGDKDVMYELKVRADGDTDASKVDLGVGVYRSHAGGYYELSAIRQAKKLLSEADLGHDYEVTTGNQAFLQEAKKLLFGSERTESGAAQIATVQTISGTGANHLGAAFAHRFYPNPDATAYIGVPAWANYKPLFQLVGVPTREYNAYDKAKKEVDFDHVLCTIRQAPIGSIFILQACCANPTGADFTREQWAQLADELKNRKHLPFFDIAYQGFGDGMEEDAWPIREFHRQGFEMIVCQSFSKNMGLYGERVGALHVVTKSQQTAANVLNQLRCLIRYEFSSSPIFGARIATTIMRSDELKKNWTHEVERMRQRLLSNRRELYELLTLKHKTPGNWDNIIRDKGLFSILPLSAVDVETLATKHHIYLPPNGRINLAGLTKSNMDIVAEVMDHFIRRNLIRSVENTTATSSFL